MAVGEGLKNPSELEKTRGFKMWREEATGKTIYRNLIWHWGEFRNGTRLWRKAREDRREGGVAKSPPQGESQSWGVTNQR